MFNLKVRLNNWAKNVEQVPGDQEGLSKLAIQLRTFFYSAIYNTALFCGFI
jgi:hypothetical protein